MTLGDELESKALDAIAALIGYDLEKPERTKYVNAIAAYITYLARRAKELESGSQPSGSIKSLEQMLRSEFESLKRCIGANFSDLERIMRAS